jgi:hypothetical protein
MSPSCRINSYKILHSFSCSKGLSHRINSYKALHLFSCSKGLSHRINPSKALHLFSCSKGLSHRINPSKLYIHFNKVQTLTASQNNQSIFVSLVTKKTLVQFLTGNTGSVRHGKAHSWGRSSALNCFKCSKHIYFLRLCNFKLLSSPSLLIHRSQASFVSFIWLALLEASTLVYKRYMQLGPYLSLVNNVGNTDQADVMHKHDTIGTNSVSSNLQLKWEPLETDVRKCAVNQKSLLFNMRNMKEGQKKGICHNPIRHSLS